MVAAGRLDKTLRGTIDHLDFGYRKKIRIMRAKLQAHLLRARRFMS